MGTLDSTTTNNLPLNVLFHQIYDRLTSLSTIWAAVAIAVTVMWLQSWLQKKKVRAPTVTFFPTLVPRFFSRVLFNSQAQTVIYNGYKKFKDSPYRILTLSGDWIVIPVRYSQELRALPSEKLNAPEAIFENQVDSYITILTGSNLHTETIQKALTPALPRLIPHIVDELNHSFKLYFPDCDDTWAPVNAYNLIMHLVVRASSRVFVGPSLCRNVDWHYASITLRANIFETAELMRLFPRFLHPIIGPWLPCVQRFRSELKVVKALIIPEIEARRSAQASENTSCKKPDDFLQWMMDLAKSGYESDSSNLVETLLGTQSVAVVHMLVIAVIHVMYDLIEHPEHIEPLVEEAAEVLKGGWENARQSELLSLKKLDSFMKESQRWNPPRHFSFHRIVKQDMTLSDGFYLPTGTHICMPSGPISMDPAIVCNADQFDGFRWFREDKPSTSYVSMSPTHLHFGLGRYACPGRAFTAYVMKAILARILLDYEFRYEEGRSVGRPANTVLGDVVFPDEDTNIYFRRRKMAA